jgi:hypothetical protein
VDTYLGGSQITDLTTCACLPHLAAEPCLLLLQTTNGRAYSEQKLMNVCYWGALAIPGIAKPAALEVPQSTLILHCCPGRWASASHSGTRNRIPMQTRTHPTQVRTPACLTTYVSSLAFHGSQTAGAPRHLSRIWNGQAPTPGRCKRRIWMGREVLFQTIPTPPPFVSCSFLSQLQLP